ncbi:MAG: hypothetical protein K2N67_01760 [Mucispirillum sp.]|nr:hypothetical protein [Mucispirillum sp.]
MFIHQTHNFYIIANISDGDNGSAEYLKKKREIFNSVLLNIGAVKVEPYTRLWQLSDVMYSAAADVYDIISNEMIRIVTADQSVPVSEKKLYELSAAKDHVIVCEFASDNTYVLK